MADWLHTESILLNLQYTPTMTTTPTPFNHLDVQADRAFGTDSCHEVFFVYFTQVSCVHSLFLNRTLLGVLESLRSESGIQAFVISI